MKLTKVDALFFGLSEGTDYTADERLCAWFVKYAPAKVATKDEASADAALAVCGGNVFVAKGVPLDQARAWALRFSRAAISDKAVAADTQVIKP